MSDENYLKQLLGINVSKEDIEKLKNHLILKKQYEDLIREDLKSTKNKTFYTNDEYVERYGLIGVYSANERKISNLIKDKKIPENIFLNMKLELKVINQDIYNKYKK